MFGLAVERRSVVLTRDYLADQAFSHAEDTDRVVRDIGIRSMVVAPLVAGETVFGALGTFSSRLDAFSESDIRLVRALSDHAAASMANARLIEALDASRSEVAARADVERSLREIAARISAATDLPAVLQLTVDEAARLMRAEGSRIDLIDPTIGQLRGAYAAGSLELEGRIRAGRRRVETLDQGVAGSGGRDRAAVLDRRLRRAIRGSRTCARWTTTSRRTASSPSWPSRSSTSTGPFGALLVSSGRPDAWSDDDAGPPRQPSPTRPRSRSGRPA